MAETVQYYLEQMVPELEDLERKEIFTKVSFNQKEFSVIFGG